MLEARSVTALALDVLVDGGLDRVMTHGGERLIAARVHGVAALAERLGEPAALQAVPRRGVLGLAPVSLLPDMAVATGRLPRAGVVVPEEAAGGIRRCVKGGRSR